MKTKIFVFVLATVCSAMATAQSLDEIVNKHLNASGGAEKLRSIRSLVLQNNIALQGIELENKTSIIANKQIRSESILMGNSMVQAFDGNKAWEIIPALMGGTNQPREMSAEATKSLLAQMDPFALLDYSAKKTKLEYLGTEEVRGQQAWHLKMTTKDSSVSELWIESSTGFLRKMKNKQEGMPNEIIFSSEREQGGIYFATHMDVSNPAAGSISIDTKMILINPEIDTAIFQFPVKK